MSIKINHIAVGTKFEVDGVPYTLVKTIDGGLNWMGEDGFYKLCQSFYCYDELTPEILESMKKHLP